MVIYASKTVWASSFSLFTAELSILFAENCIIWNNLHVLFFESVVFFKSYTIYYKHEQNCVHNLNSLI